MGSNRVYYLLSQDPENEKQWEATGKFIAKRNLLASIPNLTCGFGVWLVWSGKLSTLSLESISNVSFVSIRL